MNGHEDLGRLLTSAMTAEVETMDIDRRAARNRLEQELTARDRQRSARRWLAAAVVLAVAALVAWSATGPNRAMPPAAPGPSPSPTTGVTPADDSWPFLLDLRTLAMSPLPSHLVHDYPLIASYSISPDGTRVAVVKCILTPIGCEGNPWIGVASLDDPALRQLPVPDAQLTDAISWSPDGTAVVVGATDGSARAVGEFYLIEVATGRTRQVTDIPLDHAWWWSLQPTFSPDGASILYDLPRGMGEQVGWDVWSVPVSGGPATIWLRDAKAPRAVPGSSAVAFVRAVHGSWYGSAVSVADGSKPRPTIVAAQTGIAAVVPSPNGDRLAYEDDGSAWVVELHTRLTRRVSTPGTPVGWRDNDTLLIVP